LAFWPKIWAFLPACKPPSDKNRFPFWSWFWHSARWYRAQSTQSNAIPHHFRAIKGILMDFVFVKFIHLLGVVLFLGNIIISAVWKNAADRTRTPAIIAFSCRMIKITDLAFTASGVLLIAISGLGMYHAARIDLAARFNLQSGIFLFMIAAVIWLLGLIPLQRRMAHLSHMAAKHNEPTLPDTYYRATRLWNFLGAIAVILPIITLWLMLNP
jgi:uncharacterized membrane protein